MREIKFRGKRIDNSEWVIGYLFKSVYRWYIIELDCSGVKYTHEINYDTCGQYTGLKDEKGKEIYEGDVLRMITNIGTLASKNFKVEWSTNLAAFYSYSIVKDGEERLGVPLRSNPFYRESEVIGTIFENPELLENKKK